MVIFRCPSSSATRFHENPVSRFPSRFQDKYKEHGNAESVRWQAEAEEVAEVATEVEEEAVDTENREYSQQPPNELDMHTDTFLSYLFIYLFVYAFSYCKIIFNENT